ncbi:MAG: hypothetical protein U1E65_11815 [Myxococcota bacterium]
MAGMDRLGNALQTQIQTGLSSGTLTQDQATQLNSDYGNLQQAIANQDPQAIRAAMQQLRGDAQQDGIQLPHHHHKHGGGLHKLKQAAEDGDPQAQELLQQLPGIAEAANQGDPAAQQMMEALLGPGAGSMASQAAAGNPYLSNTDTFNRG